MSQPIFNHCGATNMAVNKPNFLIIWVDDIGYWNISHYSKGMMGYPTPNIDRIAQEGRHNFIAYRDDRSGKPTHRLRRPQLAHVRSYRRAMDSVRSGTCASG